MATPEPPADHKAIMNVTSAKSLDDRLPISCILPVYHAVSPAEFIRAFHSISDQTRPIDEIIVVFDGPVDESIRRFVALQDRKRVTLADLPENRGVAAAMREGFAVARNRWVARHDADDIALPHRFEAQWPLVSTERYGAVGGMLLEFSGDPRNIVRARKLPTEPAAIAKYVRTNSPMNNQTAVFDREAVEKVGGVRDLLFMEDYDLFARLIADGYELRSLPEPLVLFQASDDVFARRADKRMRGAERQMQRNLVSYGLISRSRSIVNLLLRQGFRMLPRPLLKIAYGVLFDHGSKVLPMQVTSWLDGADASIQSDQDFSAESIRRDESEAHEVRD